MPIKIFLPDDSFNFNYFYGYKRNDGGEESYYVIKCMQQRHDSEKLLLIGSRNEEDDEEFKFLFKNNQVSQVICKRKESLHILFYNPKVFDNFNPSDYKSTDSNFILYLAEKIHNEKLEKRSKNISSLPLQVLLRISNLFALVFQPASILLQKTSVYRHSKMWRNSLSEKRLKNGSIIFDILLGIIVCFLLHYIGNPENHFMNITELVLDKLRMLLKELDGSPAGLKLNVQLNNFLHSCFVYHVDLWWNFILIVEPAISYLFVPITIFGLMGFTFQCAMFCDILTLITLHAHCFYIYAAMLYKLELTSLKSLWRIVLGRRLNVLKNRVESQEYSNRQLFLATLFFTTLLFLLPTVIIYYVVFASLRLLIYCLTFCLMSLQRIILMFPFFKYLRWIFGLHTDLTNISFALISIESFEGIECLQFKLSHIKSSPWKSNPFASEYKNEFSKPLPINQFAKNLLVGELMAFIPDE